MDMLGTLIGSFQGDEVPGKIQLGLRLVVLRYQRPACTSRCAPWPVWACWANFIGMLTDSRSFLSYTRHELFRRLMCNLVGEWVEKRPVPPTTTRP